MFFSKVVGLVTDFRKRFSYSDFMAIVEQLGEVRREIPPIQEVSYSFDIKDIAILGLASLDARHVLIHREDPSGGAQLQPASADVLEKFSIFGEQAAYGGNRVLLPRLHRAFVFAGDPHRRMLEHATNKRTLLQPDAYIEELGIERRQRFITAEEQIQWIAKRCIRQLFDETTLSADEFVGATTEELNAEAPELRLGDRFYSMRMWWDELSDFDPQPQDMPADITQHSLLSGIRSRSAA